MSRVCLLNFYADLTFKKLMELPVYNEFFKFFIVEEIALQNNLEKIHYGKCSIIGYLSSCDCLQSLSIPNLQK